MIDEVPVVGSVEEEEVGRFPGLHGTDFPGQAERSRRVQRHARQRLFDRKSRVEACVRRDGGQRFGVAGAGVGIGRDRDRDSGGDQVTRGRAARPHPPRRSGQQHGDGPGAGQRLDLSGADEEKMIRGRGGELGGQARASGKRELVGVDSEGQPRAASRFQDAPRLRHGEDALFAEDVAETSEPLPRDPRHDFFGNDPDPLFPIVAKLGGNLVRRKKCRHESRKFLVRRQLLQEPKSLQLVVFRQAVSGLGFGGGGSVREHRREPAPHGRFELLVGAGARRSDRGVDPAAFGRDRRVALAGETSPDFRSAVSEPDRMCVGVDQARNDRAAGGVERLGGGLAREFASVIGFPSGEDDAAVLRAHGGVFQAKDLALPLPASRLAAERGGKTADVADFEGFGRHGHSWAGIYTLVIPSAARDPFEVSLRLERDPSSLRSSG
jgi:hypothetical protein